MKRLHQIATNYLISKGYEGDEGDKKFSAQEAEYVQAILQPSILEFIKYVWDHKDDEDVFDYPFKKTIKSYEKS